MLSLTHDDGRVLAYTLSPFSDDEGEWMHLASADDGPAVFWPADQTSAVAAALARVILGEREVSVGDEGVAADGLTIEREHGDEDEELVLVDARGDWQATSTSPIFGTPDEWRRVLVAIREITLGPSSGGAVRSLAEALSAPRA